MIGKRYFSKIGKKLKNLRKEKELKLKDVAKKTGLTQSYISMIENSKSIPSLQTLALLAKIYHVDFSYFFEPKMKKKVVYLDEEQFRVCSKSEFYTLKLLTPVVPPDSYHVYELEMMGKNKIKIPLLNRGKLYIYCMEGSLKLVISGASYLIEPSNALMLESDAQFVLYSLQERTKCFIVQNFLT